MWCFCYVLVRSFECVESRPWRRVEEVEDLGGRLDAVLGSHLGVDEAVVLAPHEVLQQNNNTMEIV